MCGRLKKNNHDIEVGALANFLDKNGRIANGVFGIKPVNGSYLYNARVEHVRTAWSHYIDNRGILIVDGFYEKNWYFSYPGKQVALPVIYNEDYDFMLITRVSLPPVLGVHSRMPMILAEDAHKYWQEKCLFRSPEDTLIREPGKVAA